MWLPLFVLLLFFLSFRSASPPILPMKKNFTLLFIISVLFLGLFLIPHTDMQSVNVQASYYNVFQQIQKPENWKRLSGPASSVVKINERAFRIQMPASSMLITYLGGNFYNFTLSQQGKEQTYYIELDFNSQPHQTSVHIFRKMNLFTWIFNPGEKAVVATRLTEMKAFMENTQAYYGFPIHLEKELDSNIVVIKKNVSAGHLYAEAMNLGIQLHSYLNLNKISQVSPLIAEFGNLEHDSVMAMIGVPVGARVKTRQGFEFMHMPAGRILSTTYTGKYSSRIEVYAAMRKYIQDQSLQTVVQPYEKFTNNHLPDSDSSLVTIKVNFPVL